MLESVALNTDVILPPFFIEIVKTAIERDGLALARVPPQFEGELIRFGPQDPIGMLKFRAASQPRDPSGSKILDVCLLAVVKRLDSRVNRDFLHNYSLGASQIDVNLFRDILMTIFRQLWILLSEIAVCYCSYQYRMKICTRS
jgi:hypothetical protein